MPAITPKSIKKEDINNDLHKEYFITKDDRVTIQASDGYILLEDMFLNIDVPIECDALVYFSAEIWSNDIYTEPHREGAIELKIDGNDKKTVLVYPIADIDEGVATTLNTSIHYGIKNLSAGTHDFEIYWEELEESGHIYCEARTLEVILFYR